MGQLGVNAAQPAGNHDGLVVAAIDAVDVTDHGLLVLAEVAQQIGSAKFVVEGSAAQRTFGHDLQGGGDVFRLATRLIGPPAPEFGNGETGQTGLGLGAAAGGAFVSDFTPCPGRCTRERRNGGGVVMGLDLHQDMLRHDLLGVGRAGGAGLAGHEALDLVAFHHRGVVRVRHHRMLGVELVGVANHGKQAFVLILAINRELGVEDFVTAMLAVGLGKHHQLDIGRVAPQARKGLEEVLDFVIGQRQAPGRVGFFKGGSPSLKHIHVFHRRGMQFVEQRKSRFTAADGAFSHTVMQ